MLKHETKKHTHLRKKMPKKQYSTLFRKGSMWMGVVSALFTRYSTEGKVGRGVHQVMLYS